MAAAVRRRPNCPSNADRVAGLRSLRRPSGSRAETHLGVAAEASGASGAGAVPTGAAFPPPDATVRIVSARPASRTREDTARRPRDLHGAARGVRVKLQFPLHIGRWIRRKPGPSQGIRNSFPGRRNPRISKARRWRLRPASDSIWSKQEDRAKTSTRNSGAQAAGRLPLNRLRRGTSRKPSANMDLMTLRGRNNGKAMKGISRDSLSFQSKTTSFSFFGPEGSNLGKAAK